MTLSLIDEAREAGARMEAACEILGLSVRAIQRWRRDHGGEDRRHGPKHGPTNKLSAAERKRVLEVANCAEFRALSPKQIVPRLADQDVYIASESTFYRVLKEEGQMAHRGKASPARHKRPRSLEAAGPNQVWSWDITYMRSPALGEFYYLYMFVDVWSRKIVGWEVHDHESMDLAARLATRACKAEGISPNQLTLHSDNGGPMKGATMVATLQRLGVIPSFSRPKTSDDNPYSEALFKTLKYRPEYPGRPFNGLDEARQWVDEFVRWYNTEHLHSAIKFVTPTDRHEGREVEVLDGRAAVYEKARGRHPERWSGATRSWEAVGAVTLNPDPRGEASQRESAVA